MQVKLSFSYLDHVAVGQHKVLVLATSILLLLCWEKWKIASLFLDNADNLLLSRGVEVVTGLAEKQLQVFRDISMRYKSHPIRDLSEIDDSFPTRRIIRVIFLLQSSVTYLPAISTRWMAWGIAKPSYTGTEWVTPSPESRTTPVVLPDEYLSSEKE